MRPKNSKRFEKTKLRLDIIAVCIGFVVSLIAITEALHPFKRNPEADLSIVDFEVVNANRHPILKLKLRNRGGTAAFVKGAELVMLNQKVEHESSHATTEVSPVVYDWLITDDDMKIKRSHMSLSRKMDANDVDNLELRLALEPTKTALSVTCILNIDYNEHQRVTTAPIKLTLINSLGDVPVVASGSQRELSQALSTVKDAYTLRGVLEKLNEMGDCESVVEVRKLLTHSDSGVRVSVLAYLRRAHAPSLLEDAAAALRDADPRVRAEAFDIVKEGGRNAIPLVDGLASDPDATKREMLAALLGEIGDERSSGLLANLTRDRGVTRNVSGAADVLVAASAVRSLAKIRSPRLSGEIPRLLRDSNESVVRASIEAVAECRLVGYIGELRRLAQEAPVSLQPDITRALKALGHE